ncbi:hypothetical protein V6N12_054875 [Hibiscus sabdariffa]|uniref:RNase H type-1 domain-containing protein n=1 Tax=Hibiscus sabdariffa TaxID=183260 RepID=A0ABR2D1Q6_9ROSI
MWKRPDPGWICLNVDDIVSTESSNGAIRGLFRDHFGSWISGFQKTIGKCSPLQAELWAIFTGLNYSWDQVFTLLQIQTDCKEVVTMLNAVHAAKSTFPLVRATVKLRQKGWVTDIYGFFVTGIELRI